MRQETISTHRLARLTRNALLVAALTTLPLSAQNVNAPQAVSPGAVGAAVRIAGSCPTFSWSGVAEATGYELVLYRVDKTGALEQILEAEVPGDARGWTPSADLCPTAGADYAWAIRGLTARGTTAWSEPMLFQTPGTPSDEEVRQALETLRRHRERREGDSGEGLTPSRIPAETPSRHLGTREDARSSPTPLPDLDALTAPTVGGTPSPQVVTPPASFSLNLSGDLSLGPAGKVFLSQIPFIHNDKNAGSTAVGWDALISATPGVPYGNSGIHNTAFGHTALMNTSSGARNTALGYAALVANTTGSSNTAVGLSALASNTTGSLNTGVGSRALQDTTTGLANTAVGYSALSSTTEGSSNTAVGVSALANNTTGIGNSAFGSALPRNTIGDQNTAIGALSLVYNTDGSHNVAVGITALYYNTTGDLNTAIGPGAGHSWTTGNNNVAVGVGASGVAGESGTTRIGGNNHQTRVFIEGIEGVTTGMADAVPVLIDSNDQLGTISSSARFKEDIHDLGRLSARLADLRPVAFRYRKPFAGGAKPIQFGLIAEEVAEVFPELVVYDEEGRPETVKYHLLSTLLLNEVQRQQQELERLESLDSEVASLKRTVAEQRRRLDRLAQKKRFRR